MANNHYKTICYYSDEDQCYIMFAPDLPGCFADGDTVEEAKSNISVVIDEWIEYASELGRDIPDPLGTIETTNPSVVDIARYILSQTGPISTIALQKLVYYCQAWTLAWYHTPLFSGGFEAWKDGPVCRELFNKHQGRYVVSAHDFQGEHGISPTEQQMIDDVLSVYKDESADKLVDLTHSERPWLDARGNTPLGERSRAPITQEAIESFYGSLV